MTTKQCSVTKCDRPVKARGYCNCHYVRFMRHGDPLVHRLIGRPSSTLVCIVNDCDDKHVAKGFCAYHYNVNRRGHNPHEWIPPWRASRRNKRECRLDGNICYIRLSDGREAMVDMDDRDLVKDFNWSPINTLQGYGYVATNVTIGEFDSKGRKKYDTLYLHRHIMGQYHKIDGFVIDHINHNGLDNRKENLRVTTPAINTMNRVKLSSRNTSGYRGVHRNSNSKKWVAILSADNHRRSLYLGLYNDPAIAGAVWDIAAVKKYGDDIFPQNLNFPGRIKEYKALIQNNLKIMDKYSSEE